MIIVVAVLLSSRISCSLRNILIGICYIIAAWCLSWLLTFITMGNTTIGLRRLHAWISSSWFIIMRDVVIVQLLMPYSFIKVTFSILSFSRLNIFDYYVIGLKVWAFSHSFFAIPIVILYQNIFFVSCIWILISVLIWLTFFLGVKCGILLR